jgi:hypothetical protein
VAYHATDADHGDPGSNSSRKSSDPVNSRPGPVGIGGNGANQMRGRGLRSGVGPEVGVFVGKRVEGGVWLAVSLAADGEAVICGVPPGAAQDVAPIRSAAAIRMRETARNGPPLPSRPGRQRDRALRAKRWLIVDRITISAPSSYSSSTGPNQRG